MKRGIFRQLPHGSMRWVDVPGGRRALDAMIADLPRPGRSRLASIALRIALFAVPVTGLAVLYIRGGRVELAAGLVALAAGLLLALAALIAGSLAVLQMWRRGTFGFPQAITACVLGAALLGWPAWSAWLAFSLPAIADVTTNPADPPAFTSAAAARLPFENPAAYPGQEVAAEQAMAYPDVEQLRFDLPPEDVYAAVTAVLADRSWEITDPGRQPDAANPAATVRAVDRSLVLGFPDDIVIRIRADGDETVLDMRSASRIGAHDLGSNGRRVEQFLREVTSKAGTRGATAG